MWPLKGRRCDGKCAGGKSAVKWVSSCNWLQFKYNLQMLQNCRTIWRHHVGPARNFGGPVQLRASRWRSSPAWQEICFTFFVLPHLWKKNYQERESTETKNFKCLCVGLLGLPNKEPQTGKLNRNMLSYNSGSWKSETKVSMGLVPSKGGEGETVLGISPQFIDGPLLCVPSFRLPSICVCLCAKLFHKDTSRITLGPTRMTSS